GNPVLVTGRNIVVVRLEPASFEASELVAVVVKSLAGLGESDATDARWSNQTASLALDVRDAALHRFLRVSQSHKNEMMYPGSFPGLTRAPHDSQRASRCLLANPLALRARRTR